MSEICFICGYANSQNLERHHIVPRRFGGSDDDDNLVTLCPTCHRAVEKMLDKRFYEKLGVYHTVVDYEDEDIDPIIENVQNVVEFIVRQFQSTNGSLPASARRLILVICDEFGMTGQFCFSCQSFYNTRFETDEQCPNCKGFGFHREVAE